MEGHLTGEEKTLSGTGGGWLSWEDQRRRIVSQQRPGGRKGRVGTRAV